MLRVGRKREAGAHEASPLTLNGLTLTEMPTGKPTEAETQQEGPLHWSWGTDGWVP